MKATVNKNINVSFRTITPSDAKKYLATSERNRAINIRRVERYARDMVNGCWSPATLLIFDDDGHMVDAHHRMEAVVKANVPVQMCVLTGLPKRYVPAIDTGRPRTAGDMLAFVDGLEGVGGLRNKAAIARLILAMERCDTAFTPSYNEIADKMLEEIDLINKAYTAYGSIKTLGATVGVAAGVYRIYKANGYECKKFDEFWNQVASGEMLQSGMPAFALRNAIFTNGRTKCGGGRQWADVYFVLRAWSAYVANEQIRVMRRPKDIRLSEIAVAVVS